MNPEEVARQIIDGQLAQAGWLVQDRAQMNLYVGRGVVVREVEVAFEAEVKRAGRLRQAMLRNAFEGKL